MNEYIFYITPAKEIAVCDKQFWAEHGHLDDKHNKALFEKMQKLGFTELRPNVFWRPNMTTLQEAVKMLQTNGFRTISLPTNR